MSDKSFGDHTNRNLVKNPLLSSAVTGLSLEDLTHKAVLLPVSPSLDQISKSDQQQGTQSRTLAHTHHDTSVFPSGDALSNVPLSNPQTPTNQTVIDSKNNVKLEENPNTQSNSASKASVKSDDDFDVNEYIARLQGTRYVSAPLQLKEDKKANLDAAEENLEEINLNESLPIETQQSLTADIAQNFSQLPTVLPHVASAVFSSFSNMLYKNREQTPDRTVQIEQKKSGYDDVQFQRPPEMGVPLMGVEEYKPKEVAPPPKEPPVGGASNFRISTKKKYAQIPGLSSGDAAQSMAFMPGQNMPPIGQNMPLMGQNMPPVGQNMPSIGQNMPLMRQNMPPIGQNTPPVGQNIPPMGQNVPPMGQNMPPVGQNVPSMGQNVPQIGQNMPPVGQNMPSIGQNMPSIGPNMPPTGQNMPSVGQNIPRMGYGMPMRQSMPPTGHSMHLPPLSQNMPPICQNIPPMTQNMPSMSQGLSIDQTTHPNVQNAPSHSQNIPHTIQGLSNASQNMPPATQSKLSTSQSMPATSQHVSPYQPSFASHEQKDLSQNMLVTQNINTPSTEYTSNIAQKPTSVGQMQFSQTPPSVGQNMPIFDPTKGQETVPAGNNEVITEMTPQAVSQSQYNIFNPVAQNQPENRPVEASGLQPYASSIQSSNFFTLMANKEQNAPPAAIIPPPPMFSNAQRKDSQSSVGKSILPPSVARRITANQPTIKPVTSTPSYMDNIFVPAPVASTAEQVDSFSSPPSAFVPTYGLAKSVSESIVPPPIQMKVSANVPSSVATPVTYFTPSEGNKGSNEPASSVTLKTPPVLSYLPPTLPTNMPNIAPPALGSTPTNAPPASPSMPPTSAFTPEMAPQNIAPPMFQANQSAPYFNPQDSNIPHLITQTPTSAIEPPKPVPEPPKAIGATNFRMNKKRPQYYAGPIEGVGAISNNVKPVLASVVPSAIEGTNFQGALFTPDQSIVPPVVAPNANIDQAMPFDISKPVESYTPYDISKPQEQPYGTSFIMGQPESRNYEQEYNTPFDTSRDPKDLYKENNQESKGFGIIGSLKSKLSSIDINKIQNTVTTFFDPAYNDSKVADSVPQNNMPYQQQQYGQNQQGQSNFDIFVPSAEHNQYSQYTQGGYDYNQGGQHYQTQDLYTQNQSQDMSSYSTSSYFTNPNYSTEQVFSSNPLYDNTQPAYPAASVKPQENIPENIQNPITDNSNTAQALYNPTAFTQENLAKEQPSLEITAQKDVIQSSNAQTSQQNLSCFNPNNAQLNTPQFSSPVQTEQKKQDEKTTDTSSTNMTYYNPNAYGNRQIWEPQQTLDNAASLVQKFDANAQQNIAPEPKKEHAPMFYNPNTFKTNNQQMQAEKPPSAFENAQGSIQKDVDAKPSATERSSDAQFDSDPTCDSALNTTKYNLSNIHAQSAHPNVLPKMPPAASFFDNPVSSTPQDFQLHETENPSGPVLNETSSFELKESIIQQPMAPLPIGSRSQSGLAKRDDTKVKETNLIESISKHDILPIVGVSSAPFFGLATVTDKSKDVAKELPIDTILQSRSLFEENSGFSFFENIRSENKIEKQAKMALSIDDVKNVLLFEPPQENIGTLLKRNASSSKLENLPTDKTAVEHFKQFDDDFAERTESSLVTGIELDANSEFNICETCREVDTPDQEHKHEKSEDLTTQMIENITSKMQLSHPLTVPLPYNRPTDKIAQFDQHLDDITQVAEETFETLQVQSATELLNEPARTSSEIRDYGWVTQEVVEPKATIVEHEYAGNVDSDSNVVHDYGLSLGSVPLNLGTDFDYKIDPNSIGFLGSTLLFSDKMPVPNNASDEIKAEIKHSHEDIDLPRQISIPTAPPAEDLDPKLDEPGVLDVHSIEQDANKDFPLEEEFIIEPSDEILSTDDDKIELIERKRSSEESFSNDIFTNRVEKFKEKIDDDGIEQEEAPYRSPPLTMASYFDTGNYAVESHFRNSFGSMRIPPGFEEEFARKLSKVSIGSDKTPEPYIPETSTQTKTSNTCTYMSANDGKENIIGSETRRKENLKAFAEAYAVSKGHEDIESATDVEDKKLVSMFDTSTKHVEMFSAFSDDKVQSDDISTQNVPTQTVPDSSKTNVQSLTDPMNFFATNEETKPVEPAADESFSRLASYFSMPPPQPDHTKSFFELSQSQNHYRHAYKHENKQTTQNLLETSKNTHIDDDTKNNIKELMKDLTSPQNVQTNIVRTINYFTVELDQDIKKHFKSANPINVKIVDENLGTKLNPSENKVGIIDSNSNEDKNNESVTQKDDVELLKHCKYCLRHIPGFDNKKNNVKSAVNDNKETKTKDTTMSTMNQSSDGKKSSVNFTSDYDVEKQAEGGVVILNEHRGESEYSPVKHHWFYRVDVEDKSVWRGFSALDSNALEDAFHSPDLNENTLVPTDGGRFDVNIVGRLRIAVYWKQKPTNVRRCSWFYKGTTDARYVPYTEAVAEKLEEEYRYGITTGSWHRKLVLPNSEMVIMHGPTVMVHFLHAGAADAFTTPPQPELGLEQATARPRVVRRSHEESEIEESEPSRIDHLLLLCHGVGSACDMRFRSVEEVVEDFRTTSLQLLQSHYRNSYDNGVVSRVEVLPISWHEQLHSGETGVDKRLACVTLDSIPRLRAFTNHTVLDVLFYTSPAFHQTIIDTVCHELNRVYGMFLSRNPSFRGEVSLGGHSLGSVILYDLLCNQVPQTPSEQKSSSKKSYVSETAATGQMATKYPQLVFSPAALYALGSPIAIFECIRGVEMLGHDFSLPTCKHLFNIFHPYDPIAYRIEPLIDPQLQDVKPSQIPHHKGRKRMHLELKDTMARVGADLKQKLLDSLRTTWNKWKANSPPAALEKVVEEEMEKEQLCEEKTNDDPVEEVQATPAMLGALNGGRRVDYVLQEAPLEMINEYLFAMSSHVGYWESEDTMLLMLREIYTSLGVQPDCTVPQQNMTVHRTKDDSGVIHETTDIPSTSRGST